MANAATLLDLRTQALDLADLTGSSYPVTARVTDYVNHALSELWDIIINSFEDYVRSTSTITLVAGTEAYALPTDFYKCLKVYSVSGGNRYKLSKFTLDELDFYQSEFAPPVADNSNLQYRILGNQVLFTPIPSAAGTVHMWYAPQLTKLSADADIVHVAIPVGWEDFVSLSAAHRLLVKEESSNAPAVLELKEMARARILKAAAERDAGEPHRITDVSGRFTARRWR